MVGRITKYQEESILYTPENQHFEHKDRLIEKEIHLHYFGVYPLQEVLLKIVFTCCLKGRSVFYFLPISDSITKLFRFVTLAQISEVSMEHCFNPGKVL